MNDEPDRLRRLAALASRLEQRLAPHEIVEVVVDHAAAAVGMDYVDIGLVQGEALVSPQVRWPLEADIAARYASTPLDAHLPTTEAARTGKSVFVESMHDYQDGHPSLQADVDASGFVSAAVVPLRSVDGEVLGVLGMVARHRVDFDDATRAAIELVAALCAHAFRPMHLGERATALSRLAGALAAAVSTHDVAAALRELGLAPVAADYANCRVLDAAGSELVSLVEAHGMDDLATLFRTVRVDDEAPVSRAVRDNAPVWLRSPAEIAARFPAVSSAFDDAGVAALATVPLRDSHGDVLGALVFGWSAPLYFDAILQALVLTIADLGAQALERAALNESEHEIVAALRRTVLGDIDAPAGVDVAVRYIPASASVGVGGDWCDLIVTTNERFVVVAGDVTGHGVEAVAAMAELRALINGLLRRGDDVGSVFAGLHEMRGDHDDVVVASALLIDVDLENLEARYASAGHPWALLRRSDGTVSVLDQAQQHLLGVAPPERTIASIRLDSGSVLVAYTDGLVERRTHSIDAGVERLVRALESCGGDSASDIAETLLEAAELPPRGGVADDAAIVVVKFDGGV